jgi:hypothetical protein
MYEAYLWIHIVSGSTALLSCLVAALAKVFPAPHKVHAWAGRFFFAGMSLVFATTLIMTALKPNVFLLLMGVFSYYFAWSGWRLARNKTGIVETIDKAVPLVMALTSLGLTGWGLWLAVRTQTAGMWIALLVFGVLGMFQSTKDYRLLQAGAYTGRNRIAAHLQMMLAASIAALTAFLVVNIQIENQFILWILPTVIITPLIQRFSRKVAEGSIGDASE